VRPQVAVPFPHLVEGGIEPIVAEEGFEFHGRAGAHERKRDLLEICSM
jgi:hypothetical protein